MFKSALLCAALASIANADQSDCEGDALWDNKYSRCAPYPSEECVANPKSTNECWRWVQWYADICKADYGS